MKIKTIARNFDNVDDFDNKVNAAMDEGWQLSRRTVLSATTETRPRRLLYAELVMLDPEPEPEATDPLDLLRQVNAFCLSQPIEDCHAHKCPLATWCDQLREGNDPSDWDLPEVDA